jgi:hypothetical protein
VRDFYAAALLAGGQPAGPPGYRGGEDEVFNAAIYDLDGNTIEAVFDRNDTASQAVTESGIGKLLCWKPRSHHESQSARSVVGGPQSSRRSQADTAWHASSSASRPQSLSSVLEDAVSQASNNRATGDVPSKTLIGTCSELLLVPR